MNANLWKFTVSAGCLLAVGLTTTAGPLKRADVAADPAWVLHLDVDGLMPTGVGQFIQGELSKPDAQAKLAAFQAVAGFDLQKQLHACTLYGLTSKPEDGVLIVYSDFDADRLVTLAKGAQDCQSETYNAHVIYNWVDPNKKSSNGGAARAYATIVGPRVIFGQRQASVAAAVDVIDGRTPTLANSVNFPQLGVNAGFVQAAARKLDLPDSDPNAAMLRLSKLMSLDIGEAQQQFKGTLVLQANDDEIAGHIAAIGQGLVALGKLQTTNPDAVKLANAVTITQTGPSVSITFNLPSADAVALMKADAARKAAKQ